MKDRFTFDLKKFNITYSAFLIAGCVFDMAVGSFIPFFLIYFFYFFIFVNAIFLSKIKTNLLNRNALFWMAVINFFLVIIFDFEKAIKLKIIVGDFFNIVWWVIFMLIVNSAIDTFDDYKKFEKKVFLFTFIFTLIASLMSAYKFYSILNGNISKSYYSLEGELIAGTSLWSDYNVFASALTLGIISGKFLFDNSKRLPVKIGIIIFQLFVMAIIFFSNSRRGVLFIVLTLIMIVAFSFNRSNIKNLRTKNLSYLLASVVILLVLFNGRLTAIVNNASSQDILTRVSTLDNMSELTSDRTLRLQYAVDLISQFNWRQIIFGDGFNYVEQYSAKFHTEIGSDYPHNFLFSTFLYGGIIGEILIFFLILKTIQAYVKNFSFFSGFAFWFVIVLIFSLTSTNTWFSIKLNIILCLLPFLSLNKIKNVAI